MFKILGLIEEDYLGKRVRGHNCDFEYYDATLTRFHIYIQDECGQIYRVTVDQSHGECGSGWCVASFGHMEIVKTDRPAPFTHVPIDEIMIDATIEGDRLIDKHEKKSYYDGESFECEAFTWTDVGGDGYYPDGGYTINKSLFRKV